MVSHHTIHDSRRPEKDNFLNFGFIFHYHHNTSNDDNKIVIQIPSN